MIIGGLTILFGLYLINAELERTLYLNELFSLVGLGIFLRYRYRCKNLHATRIRRGVYAFIALGIIYLIISYLFYDINTYGYLRNSQIVYSAFSFFLGFKIYDYIYAARPSRVIALSFCLLCIYWGEWTYSAAVVLPGLLMRYSSSSRYLLLTLVIYFYLFGVDIWMGADIGTANLIFPFLIMTISILFVFGKAYISAKFITVSLVICVLWYLPVVFPLVDTLLDNGFGAFHYQIERAFGIEDANASWRIGVWSTLIKEAFMNAFIGIGFGTPLFPEGMETKMTLRAAQDPYFMYTVGAHNSFITLLVRLGGIGLGVMCMMYWGLIASIRSNVQKWYYRNDTFRFSIFLCLLAVTFQAFFQVVIETPLRSAVYWVSWGLYYKALVTDIDSLGSVPAVRSRLPVKQIAIDPKNMAIS